MEGFVAPAITQAEEGLVLAHHGPREQLQLYADVPADDVTLLFLAGRAATILEDGRSAWPDHDAARVVIFDDHGVVDEVLQGGTADGRRLETPAFVASLAEEGLVAVEPAGDALLFRDGEAVRWLDTTGTGALTGPSGRLASARTVFDIPLQPVPSQAPLFWLHRGGEPVGVGRVEPARVGLLGNLVNSGWVTVAADGRSFFASAVRPELRGYDRDGALEWTATWDSGAEVEEPRFRYDGSGLAPDFTLFQQAMTYGPDGLLYVLSPEGPDGGMEVLVFDEDGTFLRSGPVPEDAAIYVGRRGHVYATPPATALARTEATTRAEFPTFDLPGMGDSGPASSDDLLGKVTVVNFWASWCAPCRREMPLLNEMALGLDPEEAVVVGINEDVRTRDGLAFIDEIGGVAYPVVAGEGRQQSVYHYRGLPYTVLLDREGRIVRTFYGFGSTIAPIEEALREELARIRGG